MAVGWLTVACALALLVQVSLSIPEEEFEDIQQDELQNPEEEGMKVRQRRQSGCKDFLDYCAQWLDSYCQTYKDYMKKNCPRKCGYCSGPTEPPVCADKSSHCSGWKDSGYCKQSSQWHNYMKANCAKTCDCCGGSCGGGGGGGGGGGVCSVSGASSHVKACSFDTDTCDWHNVPFDDDTDFVVRSRSTGGPSSGAGGSGKFIVLEGNGKAQLMIPFELVLASHDSDHGKMCIRFNYYMNSGTLALYSVNNRRGSPRTKLKQMSNSGSQWKCEKVQVDVSVRWQLLFEANKNGGPIALDDISFTDNC